MTSSEPKYIVQDKGFMSAELLERNEKGAYYSIAHGTHRGKFQKIADALNLLESSPDFKPDKYV